MKLVNVSWSCLICLFFSLSLVFGDIFSSIAHLEGLLKSENNIYDLVDDYITTEQQRLQKLREFADQHGSTYESLKPNASQYLSNPVNIFKLMRRLQTTENAMKSNDVEDSISGVKTKRLRSLPTKEDLDGSAIALFRLQDTYNLDTGRMADGKIKKGVTKAEKMTADDCFRLAKVATDMDDSYHALMWAKEAYLRVDHEDPPTAELTEIVEYYAYALFKQGNYERALFMYQKALTLDPDNQKTAESVTYFKNYLLENDLKPSPLPAIKNKRKEADFADVGRDHYESLCRGEIKMKPSVEKKLRCYYLDDNPFLKLARFGYEVLHYKPKVVLFKKVVSDKEIKRIKKFALPKLNRATVHNIQTNTFTPADYRISKSAWFGDSVDELFARISRRLEDMTKLGMATAEQLQIANYGIGGHYDPHFDMSTEDDEDAFLSDGWGNRIATALFYLSQPEAGGATVFTTLNLTLYPSKNDAVFWFNLRRDGSPDLNTRHAACPVLSGVKWVANKWIHEKNQHIGRPCAISKSVYE